MLAGEPLESNGEREIVEVDDTPDEPAGKVDEGMLDALCGGAAGDDY